MAYRQQQQQYGQPGSYGSSSNSNAYSRPNANGNTYEGGPSSSYNSSGMPGSSYGANSQLSATSSSTSPAASTANSAGMMNNSSSNTRMASSSSQNQDSQQQQFAPNSPEEIENSRAIARTHFLEFKAYLDAEGSRDPNARANAREKLTRLTRQQFQELSTDVYDELVRRLRSRSSQTEYLPQRPDFHPKRNQARQKLATLPKIRFRDLASDVYFELERRYPEFKEAEYQPGSAETSFSGQIGNYGDENNANLSATSERGMGGRSTPSGQNSGTRLQNSTSQKRPAFTGAASSSSMANGSNSSNNVANEVIIPNKSTLVEEDVSVPQNKRAGQHTRGLSNASSSSQKQQSSGLLMGRKSSERQRERERSREDSPQSNEREPITPTSLEGNEIPPPPGGAASYVKGQREQQRNNSNYPHQIQNNPTSPDWGQSLSRASEASSVGTRLIGNYANNHPSGNNLNESIPEWGEREDDQMEKLRSDYEFKVATMQNRIQGLEKDLEMAGSQSQQAAQHDADRVRELESELERLQERHEDALSNVEALERDLNEANAAAQRRQQSEQPTSSQNNKDEVARLQSSLSDLEAKYESSLDNVDNLQKELEGLMDTMREMNARQDELVSAQEADQRRIDELSEEAKDYKKRYESAKTELRNLKGKLPTYIRKGIAEFSAYVATSQLFVKPNQPDHDYMPTSENGAIVDTHVTSFQSSIDDLLIGGRSNAPSSVIIATKQVINAVARIDEDVQGYEAAGGTSNFKEEDKERLHALKSKCNATLSNLTTAARNHATSHGLSPVSLLDAAASHLSVTIIELVRLLQLRKAGTAINGHSQSARPQAAKAVDSANQSAPQAYAPPRRLNSLKNQEQAIAPLSASGSSGRASPASSARLRNEVNGRSHTDSPEPGQALNSSQNGLPPSNSQTSIASSNLHIDPRRNGMPPGVDYQNYQANSSQPEDSYDEHDQTAVTSHMNGHSDQHDGQNRDDQPEDWTELKNYLEQQTEQIVHSITSLLAAIRGGAQGPKLDENLSQIIIIVSQIVGILQENIPESLREEGEPIIQDLSDNCSKLAEMQSTANEGGTFTKQVKQQMATASFGVAKSVKSMNSLLGGGNA